MVFLDERADWWRKELLGDDGEPYEVNDLELLAEQQTVLMALMGETDGLGSAIDFSSIQSSRQLPVGRSDFPSGSKGVVRVSLATAVKFISDLLKRECGFPDLHEGRRLHDTSIDPTDISSYYGATSVEEYPDTVLSQIDDNSVENSRNMRQLLDEMRFDETTIEPRWCISKTLGL